MGIAITLQQYLDQQGCRYELVRHPRAVTALRTAAKSRIPGERLAKGVVFVDADGYVLAVIPASSHVRVADLQALLGRDLHLATEPEIERLFADCDPGAVPPVGSAYGIEAVVDSRLDDQPDLYFEAGDHETLVHVDAAQFARLGARAWRGRFADVH